MLDKKYDDELEEVLGRLDDAGQRDVRDYGRVLLASQQIEVPPPTPEQWARCSRAVKIYVVLVVFYHTSNRWVWESWLRLSIGNDKKGL